MTADKNINDIQDLLRVEGVNARGFGIIPKIVMQDRRLSRDAKAIYAYFRSYAGAGNTAFPSVQKICYDLDFGSEDTYRKHLKQLEDYGYIKTDQQRDEYGRYKRKIYTLIEKPDFTDVLTIPVKLGARKTSAQFYEGGDLRPPYNRVINNNSIYKNNIEQREEEGSPEDFQNTSGEINAQPELFTSTSDIDQISPDEVEEFMQYTGIQTNGQASLETYRKWRINWGFSCEMIMLAGQLTSQLAKTPNLNYVDRILSDWLKRQIKSVTEANQAIEQYRASKKVPSSKVKKTYKTDICETTGQPYVPYIPP